MTRRIVVVTGVAGGIGGATATRFVEQGWDVIGFDRRTPEPSIPLVHFTTVDFADPLAIDRALRSIDDSPVHALVNNAAVQVTTSMIDTSLEVWDEVMAVNVRAPFQAMRLLHGQLAASEGSVINVASVHAVATTAQMSVYASSKGALVALTRAAALEFAPDRVRVNAVLPGAVDTAMLRAGFDRRESDGPDDEIARLAERTPMRRVAKPEEIAEAIIFLADSERSGFMTGQALVIDGGVTAKLSSE